MSERIDVLALLDDRADAIEAKFPKAYADGLREARAAVAELIAERNRLANIVDSHEAQILRMTADMAELVREADIIADALMQDGRTPAGMTKDAAAKRLRAALARVQGGAA